MIESQARVVAVEPGFAWVETQRRSACDGCATRKDCGTAAVSRLFGSRVSRVRAVDTLGVSPGETVVVGIGEGTLLRASVSVYLVPLAGLVGGAILARWLLADLGETAMVAAGLGGLFLGFAWLGRRTQVIESDPDYQPAILRRV